MSNDQTFRIGELAELVQVPAEAAAFWVKQGLIQPEPEGPRKHRRFPLRELKLASILAELRKFGVNVSFMGSVVSQLRLALSVFDRARHPDADIILDILLARPGYIILSDGSKFDISEVEPNELRSAEQIKAAAEAARAIPIGSEDKYSLGMWVERGDAILTIELGEADQTSIKLGLPHEFESSHSARLSSSALILNLARLYQPFQRLRP